MSERERQTRLSRLVVEIERIVRGAVADAYSDAANEIEKHGTIEAPTHQQAEMIDCSASRLRDIAAKIRSPQ